jgi:hypothetical protein
LMAYQTQISLGWLHTTLDPQRTATLEILVDMPLRPTL